MPGGKYRDSHKAVPDPKVIPIDYVTCKHIVAEATRKDMWVYDPTLKEWYSPEEFNEKYERYHDGFQKFFDTVQVRDPFEGINAAYKRMVEVQTKLEDFTTRIVRYYKERKGIKNY